MCDTNGVLLGVNKYNNSLVSLDNFNTRIYKNANMAILGTSGAGKTFTMQLIARRMRLAGTPVYIIAPLKGHEFYRQAKALNGTIIRIVPGSPDCINVMEIRKIDHTSSELLDGPMPEQSELAAKIQKLHIFFSLLIPDLNNEERQLLDEAIVITYRNKGITYDNASLDDPANPGQYREMPILGDLYDEIKKQPEKEAQRIAAALELYVNGSLNIFNHRTNVDIHNRLVCFDIKELGTQLKKVGMLIVQDQVWNRVTVNRSEGKATRYYIDEFHLLLKEEQTAAYSVEIWKRFRKWGGIPTAITQNIKDLLASREVENIFENSDFVYMLNQAQGDREILAKQLNISQQQMTYVTHSEAGEGLIFYGNVILPFIDRFPQNTELYRVMTTKPGEVSA